MTARAEREPLHRDPIPKTMEVLWQSVDDYFRDRLIGPDPDTDAALVESTKAGLPAIQVSPSQGKLLALLVQLGGARRVLEIGTLGGYSTIWMARALPPDGRLVTLELDPAHAAVAQRNIDRAGLTERVQIIVAPAAASLDQLTASGTEPFDLVFIDADKPSTERYVRATLPLSRVGTVIIIDNVVRDGQVANAGTADENVRGIQRATEYLAKEPRLSATAVQTVGSKGYDGFIMAVVTATTSV